MPGEDKERTAINELWRAWRAAAKASDLPLYMSFFTPDAVVIGTGHPPLIGREAVRDFAKGFFASYRIALEEGSSDEVVISGDWAFERGPYRDVYEPLAGGTPLLDNGYALYIMKRESDGAWRYARILSNGLSRTADGGMQVSQT
jgi:uncharacterized protein (TIGR02246 family)